MLLKVYNAGAERMCSGRQFQVTGPATPNARLILYNVIIYCKDSSMLIYYSTLRLVAHR